MSHVQIDQARSATDRRSYHAGHCTGQSFFKRGKSCAGTCALHQHLRVELVHIQWIFTHQQRLHLGQDEVLHAGDPISFADAIETGIGFDLVSLRVRGQASEPLYGIGMIGLLIGVALVISAVVFYVLSRRFGLWETPTANES